MNRRATWSRCGLCVPVSFLLLALAAGAAAQRGAQPPGHAAGAYAYGESESGFQGGPLFSHTGPGADFLAVGMTTRASVHSPPAEPLFVFVPPVPDGAWLEQAIVSWSWMLNGPPPLDDVIVINGQPVHGGLVGTGSPDLCWSKEGVASYLAPIDGATNPLVPGINVFTQVTDRPLGSDAAAYGEGLSVLYVHERLPGSSAPWRAVDVFAGYTSNTSREDDVATVLLEFANVHWIGDLHVLLNGLDGQLLSSNMWHDQLVLNGLHHLGGLLPGTLQKDDAWAGLLGPTGHTALYDHADGDLAALGLLAPGTRQVTLWTHGALPSGFDCIGHSLAAASFPTIQPFVESSPGLPGTGGIAPALYGDGRNIAGGPTKMLILWSQVPSAPVTLVVGFWPLSAVFKGGILGPNPDLVVALVTDAGGMIALPYNLPGDTPPFSSVWLQYWMKDPGGPMGFAASNTLVMTTQ